MTDLDQKLVEECAKAYLLAWGETVLHSLEWDELDEDSRERVKRGVLAVLTTARQQGEKDRCMSCGAVSSDLVNHHCQTCRMLSELRGRLAAAEKVVEAARKIPKSLGEELRALKHDYSANRLQGLYEALAACPPKPASGTEENQRDRL